MSKWVVMWWGCALWAVGAVAQTAVTNNNNGTTNTIPVYTGSATLGNSPVATDSNGNVGIGTTTPSQVLDIRGNALVYNGKLLLGGSNNLWAQNGATEISGNYGSPVAGRLLFGDGSGWKFSFATLDQTDLVTFQDNGDVGVGTTTPGYSLDVAGKIHTSTAVVYPDGSQQTTAWTGTVCGGDYAESVDVTGRRKNYAPGDVIVIDPNAPGKFLRSADPYSTSVAGIYSTKPGLVGRRQGDPQSADAVPMAMVGIVPTKVTAENGPIRPGDLLVTSSIQGYAMKGTDRGKMLGAVIGKALGKLDSGKGVIEVVVMLQ